MKRQDDVLDNSDFVLEDFDVATTMAQIDNEYDQLMKDPKYHLPKLPEPELNDNEQISNKPRKLLPRPPQPDPDEYIMLDSLMDFQKVKCCRWFDTASLNIISALGMLAMTFGPLYMLSYCFINICIISPIYEIISLVVIDNGWLIALKIALIISDFGIFATFADMAYRTIKFRKFVFGQPREFFPYVRKIRDKERIQNIIIDAIINEGKIFLCIFVLFLLLIAGPFMVYAFLFMAFIAPIVYRFLFGYLYDKYCNPNNVYEFNHDIWGDRIPIGVQSNFDDFHREEMIKNYRPLVMLSTDYDECRFPKAQVYIKYIVIVIILGIQASSMYFFSSKEDEMYVGFVIRVYLTFYACNINIVDICINFNRNVKYFEQTSKFILYVFLVFYFILLLGTIPIFVYVKSKEQPNFSELKYRENNTLWMKYDRNYDLTFDNVPLYCRKTSTSDDIYTTVDYAMMTTLPRLYSLNREGQCYIMPNKRGIFNSTMKYIFGKDYESQGITIHCTQDTHPYLIITSDKLFNNTIKRFPDLYDRIDLYADNITETPKSTDYFDATNLPKNKESEKERIILEECLLSNTLCEEEWETYTNKYWTGFNSDYKKLSGLEAYQLNLDYNDKNSTIKPKLKISDRGLSGTQIVVGGSFEDRNDYSYLIEIVFRKYIPSLLGSIIPFLSTYKSYFGDGFTFMDITLSDTFLLNRKGIKETKKLIDILSKIESINSSVFLVGHSITAATIKGTFDLVEYPGITFETVETNNIKTKPLIFKSKTTINKNVLNIYEKNSLLSGYDKDVSENAALPKYFYNPNVFDTACLTTIACSETMKYVPFCEQVLVQKNRHNGGTDPVENFHLIMEDVIPELDPYIKYD